MGEVKNSVGSGQAKELICTTHGHELRGRGNVEGRVVQGGGGIKGRKNWENSNNIINKIHCKNRCKFRRQIGSKYFGQHTSEIRHIKNI